MKDSEEGILAREGQDLDDENINSEDMDNHETQMTEFWTSLNEDKRKHPNNNP